MPVIPSLHTPGVVNGFFIEAADIGVTDSVEVHRGQILTRDGRVLRKIDLPTTTVVGQIVLQNAEKFRLDLGVDYPDTDVYILLQPQDFGILSIDAPQSRWNSSKVSQPIGQPKIQILNIGKPKPNDFRVVRNDLMSLEFVTDLNDRSTENIIDPLTNSPTSVNASILIAKVTLVAAKVTAVDNSIKELAN